ncbi:hypothetical protein HELRODRAFT_187216 [Helobdella robusta]|uniref:Ribosome assembly protein 1 n=1 Tax=Helobdella robusta TaxID=6412 RepID=T1FP78_HELRO|nr:hypothetical protein HELRODRAFT_187216 [Helobdella robusta]ESO00697.1 hypothetical protein HELRODRAFT_187216 [Helobdella robusta]
MNRVSLDKLVELQKNVKCIRNVCILAHVDHGKTTLADALVSSNGIISQKMSGKLRYMDSREDEQIRGITMKSSAISLHHQMEGAKEFLVNLIDSPGHIDFSGDVSTVVRLCDSAIVVVDVVEGVCPQTHAVLKQAWLQNIVPVLVLNKMDRLIIELKMNEEEAELRILQILQKVNALIGELFTSDVLAKFSKENSESKKLKSENINQFDLNDWTVGLDEVDDSLLYFSPEQGNVVFASAYDGWGFRTSQFAELYSKKLGVSEKVLKRTIWGDYYLDLKNKCIKKGARTKNKKSLFVQLILENIWKVYNSLLIHKDKTLVEKIVKALELKVLLRESDLKSTNQTVIQSILQSIFYQWLPVSKAVLNMVCELLPDPSSMSDERVMNFLRGSSLPSTSSSSSLESLPPETIKLKDDLMRCRASDDAPLIVFISKMFPFEKKFLPKNKQRPLTCEEIEERREMLLRKRKLKEAQSTQTTTNTATNTTTSTTTNAITTNPTKDNTTNTTKDTTTYTATNTATNTTTSTNATATNTVFIAFARVFSGTLKKGQKLYVFGPKHHPSIVNPEQPAHQQQLLDSLLKKRNIQECRVGELYMLMGRDVNEVQEVPAGNIVGIAGLEDHVLKSAALSSNIFCPTFTDLHLDASPIVNVAVEPRCTADMDKLLHGLKLLNQSDPCVEVVIKETGEHVIVGAGEVHLNKCLDDLKNRFARIEINVSKPTVPFRETIIPLPVLDRVNEVISDQSQKSKKLENNRPSSSSYQMETSEGWCIKVKAVPIPNPLVQRLNDYSQFIKCALIELRTKLSETEDDDEEQVSPEWEKEFVEKIWSIDFKRNCSNILVNNVAGYLRPSFWDLISDEDKSTFKMLRAYDRSVINGFQMAVDAGPMCEEPMHGVCFVVEEWSRKMEEDNGNDEEEKNDDDCGDEKKNGDGHEDFTLVNGKNSNESDEIENQKSKNTRQANTTTPAAVKKNRSDFGSLLSSVKECCRKAFEMQPQRLMWAMYTCVIQATSEVLGKMYGVLGKRHGRILSEELREGSNEFEVTSVLPVVESFGFADEFRKKTSGYAIPQLTFTHWTVIDIDPYWVPTTEEEYIHFGEKADSGNLARMYMNLVRKRKGLQVLEKLVEFGEKQRTLKKNK